MKSNSGLYFRKDKKAQIYKKVDISEPGTMPKFKYAPRAASPLWCFAKQVSQNDTFYAAHYGDNEMRLFVFNYDRKIEFGQMILYRDTWYEITRVDSQDDYNGELFVYVKNAIGGHVPSASEVIDYDPSYWED